MEDVYLLTSMAGNLRLYFGDFWRTELYPKEFSFTYVTYGKQVKHTVSK